MPMYTIRVVNRDFSASNDVDLPDLEAARNQALRGALEIGTEEVCKGSSFVGTEVIIESNAEVRDRMMIAVGASHLH